MSQNHIVAVGVFLAAAGGCASHINIAPGTIDEVHVTHVMGKELVASTSHPELISDLLLAINNAPRDRTPYNCAMTTKVGLLKNGVVQHMLSTCGSGIFCCDRKQYRDRSGLFAETLSVICSGIRSRARSDKRSYVMGESIRIRWTLTNYRDEPITVPARLRGEYEWARGTGPRSWESTNHMVSSFTIDREASSRIEPDGSCDLAITIPTRTVGEGRILIWLSLHECPIPRPNDIVINVLAEKQE